MLNLVAKLLLDVGTCVWNLRYVIYVIKATLSQITMGLSSYYYYWIFGRLIGTIWDSLCEMFVGYWVFTGIYMHKLWAVVLHNTRDVASIHERMSAYITVQTQGPFYYMPCHFCYHLNETWKLINSAVFITCKG